MSDSMAALYPFLGQQPADPAAVLADLRRSTVDKVREITVLRRRVLEADGERIAACARRLAEAFAAGGRLFAFGNGGSATDAADLAGLFLNPPVRPGRAELPALPAFVLTGDIAAVTALSNDVGFEIAYARQLAALGRPGDIAVGLSTSGNSANLLAAFDAARDRGLLTVGLAGYSGGRMAELDSIDHLFVVPSASVHRIQEAQTTVYHALWELAAALTTAATAQGLPD